MAEVHVDQSHCNYHLRNVLSANGWQLLFRDAPSASRGGRGSQGELLHAVESRGWPIPDLLFVRDGFALLIEIDARWASAATSLERYRSVEAELLAVCTTIAQAPVTRLWIGFCRSILTADPDRFFATEAHRPVDVLMAFPEPGLPRFSRPV